ncbi:MAG: hypothetical protein K9L61_00225 [Candidatus Omnitrophica bacterium]|nr:hypothetical protein [Candidatus Omnitrophota bacterium]
MNCFKPFYPKNFCRDFIEIKGNPAQLMLFMALVLGLKPFMDIWIEKKRLKDFAKMCKNYGLYLKVDCLFKKVSQKKVKNKIIGGNTLTSTVCYGLPEEVDSEDKAHVFVSKDKNLIKKGMWYPVIIKDRVFWPPRADMLNYGYVLGYPDCCIKFFQKYNNWAFYSYLYQVYRNSKKYSYLANPLLKDDYYSYIYHMPCSFGCKKTINYAKQLRKEIKKREPEFIKKVDGKLKLSFLVFYEKKIYAFKGKLLSKKELVYSEVYFVNAEPERNTYMEELVKGNRIKLNGKIVDVYRDKEKVSTIKTSKESFAPESPFLIKLN